ncbi:MAG: hypothetical protein PVF75_01350 [Granulosicoccaceae bacterium]
MRRAVVLVPAQGLTGMNPSARRISDMLGWVMGAEIVAFLMIFTIFLFEFEKYFPS